MPDDPGRVEASADVRGGARQLRQVFVALRNEGFTEHQALVIIGQIMAANQSPPPS
jgi:hypothetical protein